MNPYAVLAGIAAALLVGLIVYRLATAKDRRMKMAFNRHQRVCDCGQPRRYVRTIDDTVEDVCTVCGRTRVTDAAMIQDHECADKELAPLGPERIEDGFKIQNWRCQLCGQKHESTDGLMDTALGGI